MKPLVLVDISSNGCEDMELALCDTCSLQLQEVFEAILDWKQGRKQFALCHCPDRAI